MATRLQDSTTRNLLRQYFRAVRKVHAKTAWIQSRNRFYPGFSDVQTDRADWENHLKDVREILVSRGVYL